MTNVQLEHANHSGVTLTKVGEELRLTVTVTDGADGTDGEAGVGVPAGGTTGQTITKVDATDYNTAWSTPAAAVLEAVAGGAGFVDVPVSPATTVELDLTSARVFHHTMVANITGLSFTNVPTTTAFAASWVWVLKVDATGGYILSSTPTVTWADGRSWSSLSLVANAVNVVVFTQQGATTFAQLMWNGTVELDPYVLSFPTNGTQLVPITQAETLGLDDVTNVEADGTAGTGTLTYKKDGGANIDPPVATAFAAGEVLTVTMASSTTASAVSIPRTA